MHDILFVLIGLGVGFLVGLTSVGGGSLMTPILIFAGLSSSAAVGTDLVYSAFTRSLGAWVHWRQGTVRLDAVRKLATGSLPAALITTVLVAYLLTSAKNYTQGLITESLAGVLIFVAVCLLFRPVLEEKFKNISVKQQKGLAIAMGVLVGTLVALTSVGGGSLTFVALVILMREASTSELVGTDVFHAALLTIVAAVAKSISTLFVPGSVDFGIAAMLLIGSLPGVFVGSKLSLRLPDRFLRFGLSGTLAVVGWRLLAG